VQHHIVNIVLCWFYADFLRLFVLWHLTSIIVVFFSTFLLRLCTVDELLKTAAMSTNGSAKTADKS